MSKFSDNFSQLNWSTFTQNRLKFTVDSFNDSQMKNISRLHYFLSVYILNDLRSQQIVSSQHWIDEVTTK